MRPISTRKVPRFAGVPSFLRLPLHETAEGLDVLICGVPFDGGTTFRPGARFGPRGVRVASALTRGFHPDHGIDLFDHLKCADGGDVLCIPMDTKRSIDNITERASEIAAQGAMPFLVGGDHTISLGGLRALAKIHGPLSLVHFDAHSDTFGPAWDVELHHGTVFRVANDEGLLRKDGVLQIGVRGPFTASNDLDYARGAGFGIMGMDDIRRNLDGVRAEIQAVAGKGPTYVSFDMDALDPAFAPGTGTPVPGGMTSYEALYLLAGLVGVNIVGADVVEISPDHDATGNTALVAATVITSVLSAMAATRAAKSKGSA